MEWPKINLPRPGRTSPKSCPSKRSSKGVEWRQRARSKFLGGGIVVDRYLGRTTSAAISDGGIDRYPKRNSTFIILLGSTFHDNVRGACAGFMRVLYYIVGGTDSGFG